MKSFYSFLVLAFIALLMFGGMLISFNNIKDTSRLNNDSQELYTTLNLEYGEVDYTQLNVSNVELGVQDVDAFSAEFYSASTDSKKKEGTLDTVKNIPNLVRFTVGQEEAFGWFWDNLMWFITSVIALVGFVILFKRDVF